MARKSASTKTVETLRHTEDKRKNIPTAEHRSFLQKEQEAPRTVKYPRNTDLDPQLVWRGKDEQDWSDLVVHVPPLYIQEKVNPKVLIDDLLRESKERNLAAGRAEQIDLFADFNGIPEGVDRTEFYQHDQNWSNRMILGDSLQVMASLAEREGLRGKVQCIYFDPPYGIKFNSNFQWSTTSRDVKDGKADHITREPEQVKAFRDTWRDGIHSYLTYLRDRLTVARDLLTDSGSIFVQIGDENVHRVRAVMDEVFGEDNYVSHNCFHKDRQDAVAGQHSSDMRLLLWYAQEHMKRIKYRHATTSFRRGQESVSEDRYVMHRAGRKSVASRRSTKYRRQKTGGYACLMATVYHSITLTRSCGVRIVPFDLSLKAQAFRPVKRNDWKTSTEGFDKLIKAVRMQDVETTLRYVRSCGGFCCRPIDEHGGTTPDRAVSPTEKTYVVQTHAKVIERCLLMATDPGDLVLDPTCGSGTTAYVAEQWGRRWITIDTSRVALALARARIMGARYPYYLLADSREGQRKEAEAHAAAPEYEARVRQRPPRLRL